MLAMGALAVIASTTAAAGQPATSGAASLAGVDLSLSPGALLAVGTSSQQQQTEDAIAAGHVAGRSAAQAHDRDVAAAAVRAAATGKAKAANQAAANKAKAEAAKAAQAKAAQSAARARGARLAAANEAAAKARRDAAARSARSHARKPLASVNSGSPRAIAAGMLGQFGWPSSQFGCLNSLWNKESGWNVHAANPSSSAYGIPQSLPGSKMGSAGADWQNNAATQIRWGLGYIRSRYGSPCSAWGHSQANNWY